ncbi:hypothetical protein HRbin19_00019 [bacterium HR19]|nr:hypothetical protein HRbin19_00019 [bacterium HR19]
MPDGVREISGREIAQPSPPPRREPPPPRENPPPPRENPPPSPREQNRPQRIIDTFA